jgi:hypothetical protein
LHSSRAATAGVYFLLFHIAFFLISEKSNADGRPKMEKGILLLPALPGELFGQTESNAREDDGGGGGERKKEHCSCTY